MLRNYKGNSALLRERKKQQTRDTIQAAIGMVAVTACTIAADAVLYVLTVLVLSMGV